MDTLERDFVVEDTFERAQTKRYFGVEENQFRSLILKVFEPVADEIDKDKLKEEKSLVNASLETSKDVVKKQKNDSFHAKEPRHQNNPTTTKKK